MEKMPNLELRASLPAHARTAPPSGAGITLRLFAREKRHAILAGQQPAGTEGLTGLLPLPPQALSFSHASALRTNGSRYPGRVPFVSKVRVWNSDGPICCASLCGTWRPKINQTGSLRSASSQWEAGEETDTPGKTSNRLAANTWEEEKGRLGSRREGSALPGEMGKATPRRSCGHSFWGCQGQALS